MCPGCEGSIHRDVLAAFAGRWIADVARSERHSANPFQSASLEITVAGNTLTIVDWLVLESGDSHQGNNLIQVDGLEHPMDTLGNAVIATRLAPRAIDIVGVHAAGDGGRLRYEVSDDGRMLTVSDADGSMRVVFNRAKE
jgi:hypothetical protein